MDMVELYRRAQDGFDTVLAGVGADQWNVPSTCTEWSVRDVAGHVIWAQRQLRAWATGEDYAEVGGPGSEHPAAVVPGDPVAAWRAAREAADATLTEETLKIPVAAMGGMPLAAIVALLTTDTVTHGWDIGHALGQDVKLDPDVVSAAFDWSRANVMRRPGFFGPELSAPEGADEQTRMLAFLGRA